MKELLTVENGFKVPVGSYAYNGFGSRPVSGSSGWIRAGLGLPARITRPPRFRPVRENDVKAPSEMYALGDARIQKWPNGWIIGEFAYTGGPVFWNRAIM